MSTIWVEGEWKKHHEPVHSIHDRIRLGECVFSTILVVDNRPQFWNPHMDKLSAHLKIMGLPFKYAREELLQTAEELLHKNNAQNGHYALNIFVTGGVGGNGIKDPETRDPKFSMRTLSLPSEFPPIHAAIAQSVRRNEGSPLSQIKCGNYGENILASREAASKGANEAILLNNKDRISCASVASVIMQKDGKLYTPPLSEGAQGGITRKAAIEKLGAIEQALTPDDLFAADGVYCANSLRGCMALLSLDGKDLPQPTLIPKDFHLE